MHKVAYSEIEEIMLDFSSNLVEKKDSVRIIMSDAGSNKKTEREALVSDLEMKLIDKLYY